jgi:hypothetical protein
LYPIPIPASLDSTGTVLASGRLNRPKPLAAGISLPRQEDGRDHALLSQHYCVTLGKCLSLSPQRMANGSSPPAQHGSGSAAFWGQQGWAQRERASGDAARMGGGEPRLAVSPHEKGADQWQPRHPFFPPQKPVQYGRRRCVSGGKQEGSYRKWGRLSSRAGLTAGGPITTPDEQFVCPTAGPWRRVC